MNITHFVENLERGGLERTVIDLIGAQRDAGHACRVICLFERGALAEELDARKVPVLACGKRNGADLGAVLRARRFLKEAPPGGVLHTHNAAAHYHAVLAAAGLPLRCIVNTRHGMGVMGPSRRREWLYRRAMPATDFVAAVCEAARDHFDRDGVRPRAGLLTVPNGIRVERFAPASVRAREALIAELGWPPGSRVIGTVGRMQPVKDQANLLHAFARVRERVSEAVLLLVGDGTLRIELEQLAAELKLGDAVRFLGDRSDVDRLLRGLDIFALSSLSEGYSVALLEACAAGLPIVATDVGGNREIVRDQNNGLLVPAADPDALASALERLLQAPELTSTMGRAGRKWVLAEGSLRTMAERYLRLYAQPSGEGQTVSSTPHRAMPNL